MAEIPQDNAYRVGMHRRPIPDSLRYLADKLMEPNLHIGQISGVAASLHMLAEELEVLLNDGQADG